MAGIMFVYPLTGGSILSKSSNIYYPRDTATKLARINPSSCCVNR